MSAATLAPGMSAFAYACAAALAYTCAAALAVAASARLCSSIVPFDDGPPPGKPRVGVLVALAGAVGFSLAARGIAPMQLGLYAMLTAALVGCWDSDIRCGILPDLFTLAPLAIVLAAAVWTRNSAPLLSVAIVATPFACSSFISRGRGMGWGDVKLAALGAAALGWQHSLVAFAGACVVAASVAALRGRRAVPIAFAPYLAGSIAVALVAPGFFA